MNVKVWLSIFLRCRYGNWQSVDGAHCLSPIVTSGRHQLSVIQTWEIG